jgi:hypothetical protein
MSNHALSSHTLTLGAALTGSVVSAVSGGTYKRLQVNSALAADYNGGSLIYSDPVGNTMSVTATAGYLGNSTLAITTPDLGGVSGALSTWFPGLGSVVNWTTTATSNQTVGFCTEGGTLKVASASGTN